LEFAESIINFIVPTEIKRSSELVGIPYCMEALLLYPKYIGAVLVRYIPVSLFAPAADGLPNASLAVDVYMYPVS